MLNWTSPSGVPPPGGSAVTVALNVTAWPGAEGLWSEVSDVVVAAALTHCVSSALVLAMKFVSAGTYTAPNVSHPRDRPFGCSRLARPERLSGTWSPYGRKGGLERSNWTVPVGTAPPGGSVMT